LLISSLVHSKKYIRFTCEKVTLNIPLNSLDVQKVFKFKSYHV
jgi:hypothetical protein